MIRACDARIVVKSCRIQINFKNIQSDKSVLIFIKIFIIIDPVRSPRIYFRCGIVVEGTDSLLHSRFCPALSVWIGKNIVLNQEEGDTESGRQQEDGDGKR